LQYYTKPRYNDPEKFCLAISHKRREVRKRVVKNC
jgi:hypothetical protein